MPSCLRPSAANVAAPGCRPYAEAIAAEEAEINLCPPGGEATMVALADLLGRDPVPLDAEGSAEKPKELAVIREAECIGCTLYPGMPGGLHYRRSKTDAQ